MSEVTVVARFKSRPGSEAQLERAFRAVVPPTHEEPGCVRYALQRAVEDPATFVMIERWVSRESLDRHLQTPHVQTLFKTLEPLLAAPGEILVMQPLPAGRPEKEF